MASKQVSFYTKGKNIDCIYFDNIANISAGVEVHYEFKENVITKFTIYDDKDFGTTKEKIQINDFIQDLKDSFECECETENSSGKYLEEKWHNHFRCADCGKICEVI